MPVLTWLVGVTDYRRLSNRRSWIQAVLMALEMRDAIGALTEKRQRLGHDISFGIGIEHGFATLGACPSNRCSNPSEF